LVITPGLLGFLASTLVAIPTEPSGTTRMNMLLDRHVLITF